MGEILALFKYIINIVRRVYYLIASKKTKICFSEDKSDTYQYMDEVFCGSKSSFDYIVNKYSNINVDYWKSQIDYSVKKFFPKTFVCAKELVFDEFLPLFKDKKPILLDIGCASGEWTMLVAPKCSYIDGFEYSINMVETAKNKAENEGIENVHFYQADALTMQIDKKYNGAMMLAVLMYFDDKDSVFQILKNIYEHLTPGAYFCTRETLNNENKDIIYLFNIVSGYKGIYWNKEIYCKCYYKNVHLVEYKNVQN